MIAIVMCSPTFFAHYSRKVPHKQEKLPCFYKKPWYNTIETAERMPVWIAAILKKLQKLPKIGCFWQRYGIRSVPVCGKIFRPICLRRISFHAVFIGRHYFFGNTRQLFLKSFIKQFSRFRLPQYFGFNNLGPPYSPFLRIKKLSLQMRPFGTL